jgi:hypothetical protein
MASKPAYISCIGLFVLSLSAQAEENHRAQDAVDTVKTVSEEIIVVAQKASTEKPFHLAMEPVVTDPHSLVLQNLTERLNSADKADFKGQLDI